MYWDKVTAVVLPSHQFAKWKRGGAVNLSGLLQLFSAKEFSILSNKQNNSSLASGFTAYSFILILYYESQYCMQNQEKKAQPSPFFWVLHKDFLRNCSFSYLSLHCSFHWILKGGKRKQSINPTRPSRVLEQWSILPPLSLHKYLTLVCKTN